MAIMQTIPTICGECRECCTMINRFPNLWIRVGKYLALIVLPEDPIVVPGRKSKILRGPPGTLLEKCKLNEVLCKNKKCRAFIGFRCAATPTNHPLYVDQFLLHRPSTRLLDDDGTKVEPEIQRELTLKAPAAAVPEPSSKPIITSNDKSASEAGDSSGKQAVESPKDYLQLLPMESIRADLQHAVEIEMTRHLGRIYSELAKIWECLDGTAPADNFINKTQADYALTSRADQLRVKLVEFKSATKQAKAALASPDPADVSTATSPRPSEGGMKKRGASSDIQTPSKKQKLHTQDFEQTENIGHPTTEITGTEQSMECNNPGVAESAYAVDSTTSQVLEFEAAP